jgi:hypothetical protein
VIDPWANPNIDPMVNCWLVRWCCMQLLDKARGSIELARLCRVHDLKGNQSSVEGWPMPARHEEVKLAHLTRWPCALTFVSAAATRGKMTTVDVAQRHASGGDG